MRTDKPGNISDSKTQHMEQQHQNGCVSADMDVKAGP